MPVSTSVLVFSIGLADPLVAVAGIGKTCIAKSNSLGLFVAINITSFNITSPYIYNYNKSNSFCQPNYVKQNGFYLKF